MDRRFLLASALSVFMLTGWYFLQRKFLPNPPAPRVTESQPIAPSTSPGTPGTSGAVPTPSPGAGSAAAAPGSAAAVRPAEEITEVARPGFYFAKFSTWGAAPVDFTLDHPQYKVKVDGKDVPINLVRRDQAGAPYLTSFSTASEGHSDFDLPPDAAWTLARHTDEELVYATDVGQVHVEKKWTLPKSGYALGLELTVENRGDKPLSGQLAVAVAGWQDPHVEQGGFLSMGRRVNLTDGECFVADGVKRLVWKSGGGCTGGSSTPGWSEPISEAGEVNWVGVAEQFFIVAAALGPEAQPSDVRTCRIAGEPGGKVVARALYPSRTFAPGSKQTYPMTAFAGPKQITALDKVTVAGHDPKLFKAVNYTLEFIARPMQLVLQGIHKVVPNWGWSIIIITILLKVIMFYPTQQSMKSAKKMAKLKPQIDALKTKFPDDTARQQQEQMALFKKEGVSPFGGCLPLLLQMPIYFAFYSMLSNAVELYRASFFGPMDDMTAPFKALSIATGVLMFVQQKTAPTAADPQQQKMMQFMPIMFTVMTLFLPSGLTLYIFTNTLLTMVQQWWLNRNDPDKKPDKNPAQKPPSNKPLKPARA